MSDQEKDIRDAEAGSDPVLGFGYADLVNMILADDVPAIEPDEITPTMLAQITGLAYKTAFNRLEALVQKGRATKRKVKDSAGRMANAYRLKKE